MLERARDVAREAALEAGAAIRSFYKDEYTVRDKGEDNPSPTPTWPQTRSSRAPSGSVPRVRLVERRDRRHP